MKLLNLLNHVWRKPEHEQKPTSMSLAELCKYHVLRSEDYPCDKCNIANEYCKKLHFSNCTICVTPSDKINLFSSKRKTRQPRKRL